MTNSTCSCLTSRIFRSASQSRDDGAPFLQPGEVKAGQADRLPARPMVNFGSTCPRTRTTGWQPSGMPTSLSTARALLADMARRGVNDIPRKLHLMPYDILRAIGRPTTGRAYELLGQSLDRLSSTTVKTNIRAESRRETTFGWLDGWRQLVDERTERSRGMDDRSLQLVLGGGPYERWRALHRPRVFRPDRWSGTMAVQGGSQARGRGRAGRLRDDDAHAIRKVGSRRAISPLQVRGSQDR